MYAKKVWEFCTFRGYRSVRGRACDHAGETRDDGLHRYQRYGGGWDGRRAVAGEILDELHPLPPLHVAGKVVERVVRVCLRRSARMRSPDRRRAAEFPKLHCEFTGSRA